jgi:porphobilinogen synthase
MLKAAALQGWIDEKKTVIESIIAFRRAGAHGIITYHAKQIAKWL